MSSTQNDGTSPSETELLTGCVKWFNNKAGYGFITVKNSSRYGSDVFVHHSAINVEKSQYKYLVQGEYVEFCLTKTMSEVHEWQALKVSGINGGKLMCETRNEIKLTRTNYKKIDDKENEDIKPKQVTKSRVRAEASIKKETSRNENVAGKEKKQRVKKERVVESLSV